MAGEDSGSKHAVSVEPWGKMADGTEVQRISLTCEGPSGVCCTRIITRGATVQEISVPDAEGTIQDVVLGFDDLDGYNGGTNFCYGGTPGRYANRINLGKFSLDGVEYQITPNWEGPSGKKHALHGGGQGFDANVWLIDRTWVDDSGSGAHVTLSHTSPDGDQGFPGTLCAKVTYSWMGAPTESNYRLSIKWEATCDKTSVVNLTNHSYFNLSGVQQASQVLDTHTVTLNCSRWTEVDDDAIPTGNLLSVEGTCMDFGQPKVVGTDIQAAQGGGYDHNFVVNVDPEDEHPGKMRFVARVECTSGRCLECSATQPGVQLFTAHPFDKVTKGKNDQVYPTCAGLCLETQHFPDSPNQPSFPPTLISPEKPYEEQCSYAFSVKK